MGTAEQFHTDPNSMEWFDRFCEQFQLNYFGAKREIGSEDEIALTSTRIYSILTTYHTAETYDTTARHQRNVGDLVIS